MNFTGMFISGLLLSGAITEYASGQSVQKLEFIDNIDRFGFGNIAELYPDILYLHTTGNGCRGYNSSSYRETIPDELEEQARIGLCAMAQMMDEAKASDDTIVQARVTLRDYVTISAVRDFFESDARFGTIDWEYRLSVTLPIENPDVLLSIAVVAISPGSDEALMALPPL